ncbi:MAG: sulfatase-like hydrolase/transferase [Verrucomicrobiaceae bacterium]
MPATVVPPSKTVSRLIHRLTPKSAIARGAVFIGALFLALSLITRLALALQGRSDIAWDFSLLGSLGFGLWYDLLAASYALVPWFLLTFLLPAMLWRSKAMHWVVAVITGLYAVVLIFIAVAEWFFWDEFQVRFNFIAVDYLVFTQEVVNNIKQSYPMPLIFTGLGLIGAAAAWTAWKLGAVRWVCEGDAAWRRRIAPVFAIIAATVGIANVFSESQLPHFANEFNRELAKNGPYSFCAAFWTGIDFERFYLKQDTNKALAHAKELLTLPDTPPASADPHDLRRIIRHPGPEKRHNIVLISVESFSAAFMSRFGINFKIRSYLTPRMDQIANEGIFFSNVYATGTRTVRGLEAITLCVPPTPGQSIIWRRPNNAHLFSIGSLCKARGYDVSFVYGGNALFDNMGSFFESNDYRVVDRLAKSDSDVTFENAWGVADEDLFRWATQEADANHSAKKPFFMHVMTVSNHRPFTFPENRIDMEQGSREAAVKYTDWCIGDFLEKSKSKPWFDNTIFIIMADHCHSSAGRMELDVTKYHIPCVIWNPKLVQPRDFNRLCSQIDMMPTLFGWMNWSYTTRFYGQDVLSPGYTPDHERVFVSNYQKIAYISGCELAMLKPKQEFTLGKVDLKVGTLVPDQSNLARSRLQDTISLYQSASWLFRNGHLGAVTERP